MVDIVKSTVKNTESIKKPFGGKGGRKKKLTPVQQRMKAAEERIAKIEQESNSDHIQSSSGYDPAGSFFYTDEKFMTQFEDNEITEYLHRVHDDFEPSLHDDSKLKKAIIDILNDITLMEKTLSRYNMTILDFFKYLYRVEPSIFRGLFI